MSLELVYFRLFVTRSILSAAAETSYSKQHLCYIMIVYGMESLVGEMYEYMITYDEAASLTDSAIDRKFNQRNSEAPQIRPLVVQTVPCNA